MSQILPISFTQNLFYIALLQQPQTQPEWRVSRKAVVTLTGAYCACLIVAPITAGTEWLIPHILLARVLLVIVQLLPWKPPMPKESAKRDDGALLDRSALRGHLVLLVTLCGFAQASLAFLETPPADIGRALFAHPAVSSLGCDFVISCISYACWRSIYATKEVDDAAKRTKD